MQSTPTYSIYARRLPRRNTVRPIRAVSSGPDRSADCGRSDRSGLRPGRSPYTHLIPLGIRQQCPTVFPCVSLIVEGSARLQI